MFQVMLYRIYSDASLICALSIPAILLTICLVLFAIALYLHKTSNYFESWYQTPEERSKAKSNDIPIEELDQKSYA